MKGRVGFTVVMLHLVAAMALLPAEGAVVLDGSAQACDAPLHARVVQLGAAQIEQPAAVVELGPLPLDVARGPLASVRVPVPEVDATVRVRGPPSA